MTQARATHSALHSLIQQALGEDLDKWLARQRKTGRTWDEIASEIADRTRRRVSRESLRVWHSRATAPTTVATATEGTKPNGRGKS